MSKINEIGTPKTVGELKQLLNEYPNATSFGFRNQPIQSLFEVESDQTEFVVFQPTEQVDYTEIKHSININEFDMKALIRIRNYFGENDKTQLEHLAFDVLDRIVKQTQWI